MTSNDMPTNQKKTYRKPTVQVYGTLSELTEFSSQNSPMDQDGGSDSNNDRPNNRT